MSDKVEIDFDPTGGPYSTLYFTESHMYMDSPNGMNAVRIPESLYKELKQYAEENGEAS